MKVFRKVSYFLSFNKNTKILLIEAFILLGWARLIKNMSFNKTAILLGEHMKETSYSLDEKNRRKIKQVAYAVNKMSRYTFWESLCLVKAIAALKMLERRGIESTVYLGTAKGETGKMIAHAWLRSGPFYLTGYEEMGKFVVVSKFAKKVRLKAHKGENYGN